MKVKIMKLHKDAIIPTKAHKEDVGIDLHTIEEDQFIQPNERLLFRTGLAIQPPKGYELQLRSRSGLAYKHGVIVLNAPATIEPIYIGDVGIILFNTSSEPLKIRKGDRLAQAVFKQYEENIEFEEVDSMEKTSRGSNGFGSTGK